VKQACYLSAQLRESAPNLRDAGWQQTATLLMLAADEIEQQRARLVALEHALQTQPQNASQPNSELDLVEPSRPICFARETRRP